MKSKQGYKKFITTFIVLMVIVSATGLIYFTSNTKSKSLFSSYTENEIIRLNKLEQQANEHAKQEDIKNSAKPAPNVQSFPTDT